MVREVTVVSVGGAASGGEEGAGVGCKEGSMRVFGCRVFGWVERCCGSVKDPAGRMKVNKIV